ncbi:MAG: type II toxin-antitoxin system RelE/ParE family toxin [Candidatus Paceibacterales bacterium]
MPQRRNIYRVRVRNKARKSLRRIPKHFRDRILAALVRLRNDPYLGEPLLGEYKGKYSLHIHPYRVIYQIDKKKLIIRVLRIDHRGAAYR